jgi:hypothetical protein
MFVGHQQGLFQLSDLFSVESLINNKFPSFNLPVNTIENYLLQVMLKYDQRIHLIS